MLLALVTSAAIYARSAVGPLQEAVRFALAISDNQMAMLQGPALALPFVLAAIPLGILIDRYSRARLIFIFAVSNAGGSLLTAFAPDFASLLVARCIVGFSAQAIWVTSLSLLADLYAPDQRGRATMIVAIGAVVGMSAAFAAGGELLVMLDMGSSGWRRTMLWVTVPLIPIAFSMLAVREPQRIGLAMPKPSTREAWAAFWRCRAVVAPLIAGLALFAIADGAASIWTAPTLSRNFALPPDRTGITVAMVLLVSGVLGPIIGGFLADLCQRSGGPLWTMRAVSVLAFLSIPAGAFAIAPSVASVSILLVVFMTVGVAFNVTVPTLVTIVVPKELRGLCLALVSAGSMLCGFALAPVTVSLLSGSMGGLPMIGQALAWVCVTSSVVGAVTFAVGSRSLPRRAVTL
jgi:MFS family permease